MQLVLRVRSKVSVILLEPKNMQAMNIKLALHLHN